MLNLLRIQVAAAAAASASASGNDNGKDGSGSGTTGVATVVDYTAELLKATQQAQVHE